MLNADFLLDAVRGVHDEQVTAAGRMLGYLAEEPARQPKRTSKNVWRVVLIAAVIASLLGITAYAAGLFRVQIMEIRRDPDQENFWHFQSADGEELDLAVPFAFESDLCFQFTGDEPPHEAQFQVGWLPYEPTYWWPEDKVADPDGTWPDWSSVSDGWYRYMECDRQSVTDFFPEPGIHDVGIPFNISISYAYQEHYLVFEGSCDVVKHEYWDDYEVYELSCEKTIHLAPGVAETETVISPENYVLLFSLDEGYVINIGGSSDMPTLERIARSIKTRTTDNLPKFDPEWKTSMLNIGLG